MAVGGVGHLVGIGFHIFGEDFSTFCNICCQVIFYVVAGPGVCKRFLSGKLQLHRTAADRGGQKCVERFIKKLLFVAEACPMTLLTIWRIWVEHMTTILSFSM